MSDWKQTESGDYNVCDTHDPTTLSSLITLQFPNVPLGWKGASTYIEQLLQYSPRTRHPMFLDKLYPGTNPIGIISELVTAVMNTNVHVYKVSPVIVLTELAVMESLCNIFGLTGGDGITCPGGSFSNMLAMITARNIAFPNIKKEGYQMNSSPLVVFTSDQSHYSIKKACMVLGIGTQNLITVGTDKCGAMDPTSLRNAIEKAKSEGKRPFFVNATAGTTVRGAFDPLEEIGKICRELDCWFHIDACWGGSAIFSKRFGYLLQGSHLADSLVWNAHKMLGVPIQTSILLVKNKEVLKESNSLEEITYLFHDDDDSFDVGKKTIMCGRRADVLKLYITWQYYGSNMFETWVDHAFDNACYMSEKLKERNDFRLVFDTNSVNVCFQYIGSHENSNEIISQLNQTILNQIAQDGKIFIDSNSSKDVGVYFRLVFHSPLTTRSHIDQIIEEIVSIGFKEQSESP